MLNIFRLCRYVIKSSATVVDPLADTTNAATGIAYIYEAMQPESGSVISQYYASLSYYSICVALNALLTLMIVIRLVLHIRNIRDALGPSAGVGGLYTAIIAMLIESHAPYAIAFLLYIGPWATNSPIQYVFSPILCEMQVSAVLVFLWYTAILEESFQPYLFLGHRSVPHHSTGSQPKSTDEQHNHRDHRFNPIRERRWDNG